MAISELARRHAEDLLHAYFLEASRTRPPLGHLEVALRRWAHTMGDPLFVQDESIDRADRSDGAPRVDRRDCAPLTDSSWDEFLAYDRSWTHCNLWTTTAGELVVSLETGLPQARVPVGSVVTGHVHVMPRPLEIVED